MNPTRAQTGMECYLSFLLLYYFPWAICTQTRKIVKITHLVYMHNYVLLNLLLIVFVNRNKNICIIWRVFQFCELATKYVTLTIDLKRFIHTIAYSKSLKKRTKINSHEHQRVVKSNLPSADILWWQSNILQIIE